MMQPLLNRVVRQAGAAIVLSVALVAASASANSPNDVITSAIDELAVALDGRKDELAADPVALKAVIDPILLPRFDRKYAAQLVLGKHWRDATADQRDRFVEAFYDAMLRKYSDGVTEFDQNRVEVLPYRGDDSKPRTTVRTIVTLNDGAKTPVNYGMVRRDSGWMIFDVTIEGVSYIRNFRAELDSEVSSTSLEAMISRFEKEASPSTGE